MLVVGYIFVLPEPQGSRLWCQFQIPVLKYREQIHGATTQYKKATCICDRRGFATTQYKGNMHM
jgi:hypothetical protein